MALKPLKPFASLKPREKGILKDDLRSQMPKHTDRQYAFCMGYLQHGDIVKAYNEAGYKPLWTVGPWKHRQAMVQQVLDSAGVQGILQFMQGRLAQNHLITLDKIIEQLLVAHSHAKTASEEISAITEIAKLLGYYDKAERQQKIRMAEEKGLTSLSDYELKRLAKPRELSSLERSQVCRPQIAPLADDEPKG